MLKKKTTPRQSSKLPKWVVPTVGIILGILAFVIGGSILGWDVIGWLKSDTAILLYFIIVSGAIGFLLYKARR